MGSEFHDLDLGPEQLSIHLTAHNFTLGLYLFGWYHYLVADGGHLGSMPGRNDLGHDISAKGGTNLHQISVFFHI